MREHSDPNYEVVHHILELLPTIDEALTHMQTQLDELRLEESAILFKDTVEAIGSIAYSTQSLIVRNTGSRHPVLNALTQVRQGIACVNDAFEENHLTAIQGALKLRLIPAYLNWRRELELLLLPKVLM